MKRFYILLFFLTSALVGLCQKYSYSHYDSKDGLGSSTVYHMTQDKDGFLWFATETGLTRYDGTHFRNFSQDDGLPDNEIIQVFVDSKGRVWFSPWRKTVCYMYKGKLHTRQNDSLLQKITLKDNVFQYAEDNEGNILLKETSCLHFIRHDGHIYTLNTIENKPLGYISVIAARSEGGFWVLIDNNIYILQNMQFVLWKTIEYNFKHFNFASFNQGMLAWRKSKSELSVLHLPGTDASLQSHYTILDRLLTVSVFDSNYVAAGTLDGIQLYRIDQPAKPQKYLPGIAVSNVFKDSEGNWWFTTLGKGVYRLNAQGVISMDIELDQGENIKLYDQRRSHEWGMIKKIISFVAKYVSDKGDISNLNDFTWFHHNPMMSAVKMRDGTVVFGCRRFLQKLAASDLNITAYIDLISVKALCRLGDNLLVATEKNVVTVSPSFRILDTIRNERATCLFASNDTIYIGTLNGLFIRTPGKETFYAGDKITSLQSRIAAIAKDDNHIVWVATSGNGLLGWRKGALVTHITRKNGLTSNNCRSIFYKNGMLWVGTDKGLNKVNVMHPSFPITRYTSSEGLASDIVNGVYVENQKVFVSTTEGITFFEEEKIGSQSRCDLLFTEISVGGTSWGYDSIPNLIPHEQNSLRFDYVGISYKSAGDIRYRYRLKGLDSVWRETRETFLSYPTLPSGDYELQLQAINKFDVYSKMLTVGLTVDKLLYERAWFQLLIGLLFLVIIGAVVWLIIRRIRKREQEKTAFIKRINDLEQLSRKAQMNPHFIFNSLNSIQQYVMDADLAGANKFISGFSRLIRQTLDFTSKPEISLEEELDYLTNYLDIEQTRLENAFAWLVDIDKNVDPAEYYIPPMILQPFVENSVRHGLRFRRDKAGIVRIIVKREGDYLVCVLEDNGVGRKASLQYKSISPINYQSKGMSLTADRIAMFNREHEQKITMQIDDLEDEANNALGTRVTIHFPVM